MAVAVTATACDETPQASAGTQREFVLLADSRAAIDTTRIAAVIESHAPGWNVRILAVPGATARIAACSNWPSGCKSVLVGPHPDVARITADPSIDAVGFLFGPNEVSAVRGDVPPTWGGSATSIADVKNSWNQVLTGTKACIRLWATQQAPTWSWVTPNSYGTWTTSIAAQLNDWVNAQGAAGRVSVIRWGETADADIKQFWWDSNAGSNLWFSRAKNDPQHPISGGWGPVALGLKVAEALNSAGKTCNQR